jgi:hypothetical protein
MARNHWQYRVDISGIVNNDKKSHTQKAEEIAAKLAPVPVFRDCPEVKTVLKELVEADVSQFEDRLEALYNTCDYYRVWLAQ